MNQVWLNGRLASDPEGGESNGGVQYAKFSIAIERGSGDNKEVTYLDCVAFRQQADFVRKHFTKGSGINVVGSISIRDWNDNNGVKHRKAEILVSQVGFPVTSRSRSGGGQGRRDDDPKNGRVPAGAAAGGGREPWDQDY